MNKPVNKFDESLRIALKRALESPELDQIVDGVEELDGWQLHYRRKAIPGRRYYCKFSEHDPNMRRDPHSGQSRWFAGSADTAGKAIQEAVRRYAEKVFDKLDDAD